jgi:hypothetical protein
MSSSNMFVGLDQGLPFHDAIFLSWFIGVPALYGLCKYSFRALDWWSFPTRAGERTSDIMAFEIVCLISVCYMGISGLISYFCLFGVNEYEYLMEDRFYRQSDFCLNHLIYPMICFQGWNLVLCFMNKDLNDPNMIIHHFLTTSLAYFGLHPYLHGGSIFFFGVAECTNIPLTVYDIFKYMKPAKWQEKFPIAFQVSQYSFAASFIVIRTIVWPMISWPFWIGSVELLRNGTAHNTFVVGFFLMANVFLTLLQFFWLKLILQSVGIISKGGKAKAKPIK